MINNLTEKKYKYIALLFFAGFLLLGICVFRDYGVSCDEDASRWLGVISARFAVWGHPALFESWIKYYGPFFEMSLYAVEKFFMQGEDTRSVYFMRHLVTFLIFYTSVIFFYKLCKERFQNRRIALLGSLFLILNPRIFAHSFYNPKDIPFLSLFVISMYTLVKYIDKKTIYRTIFHALFSAALIAVRVIGVLAPLFTAVFVLPEMLNKKRKNRKPIIISFSTYLLLLVLFTIFFWPLLWNNPIRHFTEALIQMIKFPWPGSVLYFGNYVEASSLPWYYIPMWIAITTPLLYTALFFIGCLVSLKKLFENDRKNLLFLMWFFIPVLLAIAFRSVLYDGWRHMFFIYPAFVMIALTGIVSLFSYIKVKFRGKRYKIAQTAIILIITFNLATTAYSMIKYHPYQNVYFNVLANKAKSNFELDYWGLSYRKALEYILKNNQNKTIRIYVTDKSGRVNAYILPAEDRARLVYVEDPKDAEYLATNYRWRKNYPLYKDAYLSDSEYHSIKVDNAKIMGVYKLNKNAEAE